MTMPNNELDRPFFTAQTPLNCSIRVTVAYWNIITQIKHPIMSGQEAAVQATLTQPDEIRRSAVTPMFICSTNFNQKNAGSALLSGNSMEKAF